MFLLNGMMAFDERKNTNLYDMLVKISDWQIEKRLIIRREYNI